jgi:hypothetical protein
MGLLQRLKGATGSRASKMNWGCELRRVEKGEETWVKVWPVNLRLEYVCIAGVRKR